MFDLIFYSVTMPTLPDRHTSVDLYLDSVRSPLLGNGLLTLYGTQAKPREGWSYNDFVVVYESFVLNMY